MKGDRRFYSWPRLRKTQSGYLIKARFMTPFRFELLNSIVRIPLQKLWRILAGLLALELVLPLLNWRSPSDFLPVSLSGMACSMFALCVLHYYELVSRLWISILFFGIRVRVEVTEDEVIFRRIGRKLAFPRTQHVVFTAVSIPQSQSIGYTDSCFIEAVVDNSATFRLFECYDVRKASKLVVNCNYAISMSEHSSQEECDPRDR